MIYREYARFLYIRIFMWFCCNGGSTDRSFFRLDLQSKWNMLFILKYYQKINTVTAAMQIPAVTHWEEGWMFQHRALSHVEPAGLAGKAPCGYLVLCLSQCCPPNCSGNSCLFFNAGSWAGSTELQARHPPGLSLRAVDLPGSCQCSTHHEWVSEWLIWNKTIAQGSCHSVWAMEKGCSLGAVGLYALGSLPCASPQLPELMSFSTLFLRSTDPKPRQFRSGPWICHTNVWIWNLPLLLSMYSLPSL